VDGINKEWNLMRGIKSVILILVLAMLGSAPSGYASGVIKPGSKCLTKSEVKNYKGKIYTCIKVGKKLVWNKGVVDNLPPRGTTSFVEVSSPVAVTNLSAKISNSQILFSFTIPSANPSLSEYQLGYALLKAPGLDPSFELDYSSPTFYKVLANDSFQISTDEILDIFKNKGLDASGLSIMFKIRTKWGNAFSTWGNGVYLTPNQYQVKVVSPSPSPTPSDSANPFSSAAEKAAAEKAAADKAAAEKAAAEKAAAEKAAADKASASQVKYCDIKVGCKVGEIGPGNGFVFYVASSPKSWGTYLEVADTNIQAQWCNSTKTYLSKNVIDEKLRALIGDEIGKGPGNTLMMLAACTSGAAVTATNFRGGGLKDWFLPSLMELNEVCKFARVQTTGSNTLCSPTGPLLNLFATSFYKSPVIGQYWTSSEYNSTGADGWTAWTVSFFANQWQSAENKQGLRPVIAIRAFGPKT
jgi:hypothetical protein